MAEELNTEQIREDLSASHQQKKATSNTRQLHGRRVIKSDATVIDDSNVVSEVIAAFSTHQMNRDEIEYLWKYYKGEQPILHRIKEVRPEICHKIVENRANEVVSFKVGYLCGEPIQYVGRSGDESVTKAIGELNEMMHSENKANKDRELVEWQMIAGTAYRMILPDDEIMEEEAAPFELYTIDPRDAFVIYSSELDGKAIAAVKYWTDVQGNNTYSVYTKNRFWKIKDCKIVERKNHALGMIPIFEYPANNARLGSFEITLPLLDMLNELSSSRMDGIDQFVQSFIKFINCDITAEDFQALKDMGAIKVKSVDGANADVEMITSELNQNQVQTLVDYTYATILTICGVPNREGGNSTSDTGTAVLLRNGWSLAEARAKDSELMFKASEQEMLKLALRIIKDDLNTSEELSNLKLKDIALKFTRRNYENIQSKSQVLVSMLQNEKIHPLLAFEYSGMFIDPESAYQMSMEYYQQSEKTLIAAERELAKTEDNGEGTPE